MVDADHSDQADEAYSYDDNGNRVNDGYVTGENNQLQSDGKFNYQYDQEGNRVKRTEIATGEVTEYQWDHRNRLVGVETKNSNGDVIANSEYTYDVNNNRIAKSVDADGAGAGEAVVERFVYDGDHIALTFNGQGNQTERFLHGTQIDQVLAQENDNGEVLWALTDHQGSVRMLLDNNGNVVNNITYDAFGNITLETNPEVNFRFSYTGRELDSETGLYNYRSRYYDPAVGEFINEDTISFAGGDSNLYRYVGNNPVNKIDPFGFCATPVEADNNLDIGLNKPVIDLPPDLNIGLNKPVIEIPNLNFNFPGDQALLDDIKIAQSGIDWKPVFGGVFEILKGVPPLAGGVLGVIGLVAYKVVEEVVQEIVEMLDKYPVGLYIPPADQDPFNPNNINLGTYTPTVDPFPFGNVEKFPRPDDFLKGDTFTFPGGDFSGLSKPIPDFDKNLSDLFIGVLESASEDLPDLTGKTMKDAEKLLQNEGFTPQSLTKGGYQQWKHSDGSTVWIGPDGEVDRFLPKVQPDPSKKGYQPRIDQYGNPIPHLPGTTGGHHTGEIIEIP